MQLNSLRAANNRVSELERQVESLQVKLVGEVMKAYEQSAAVIPQQLKLQIHFRCFCLWQAESESRRAASEMKFNNLIRQKMNVCLMTCFFFGLSETFV